MGNGGYVARQYKIMFSEDRFAFDHWLNANAAFGSIIAVGLFAMALAGSMARDGTVANVDAPKVVALQKTP
jgi:hypothetical protein